MLDPSAIGFVTIFLGLTSGSWPVQVMTAPAVASVEIRLDGVAVAALRGEPWSAGVDFGPDLVPHQLTVVGFDGAGREVGRATQWVNMPQPEAGVEVLLERDARGAVTAARLSWASKQGLQPTQLEADLDGARLAVASLDRIPLPSVDMTRAHVLRVSVAFGAAGAATREVVLGGSIGSEASAELTAVPALVGKATDRVSVEQLQEFLQVGGQPAHVVAVEKGPVTLAMVVEEAALGRLRAVGAHWTVGERRTGVDLDSMDRRDRLFLVDPRPGAAAGPSQRPAAAFPTRVLPAIARFALPFILSEVLAPTESPAAPRLADAVAVAGMLAAGGQGRRAVVLVVASEVPRVELQRSSRLLSAIGVPLHVWTTTSPGAAPPPGLASWQDISRSVRAANTRLQLEVSRQLLVWIDGVHRPQDVTLAPGGPLETLVR